ncbi:hypothetical protein SAMN05216316_0368 [Nitrosovibrio sp. Nv6]|nr:hypothetical protein SAMN05216316_0368 [Nitrosovibrio sp. Nv6]
MPVNAVYTHELWYFMACLPKRQINGVKTLYLNASLVQIPVLLARPCYEAQPCGLIGHCGALCIQRENSSLRQNPDK